MSFSNYIDNLIGFLKLIATLNATDVCVNSLFSTAASYLTKYKRLLPFIKVFIL